MKLLDHLEEWLIAALMGAATLIVFIAVLHRYASGLNIPYVQDELIKLNTSWAQELTIFMFVWMAKFGAAYGVRTGIHVGVDVLINKLSDRNRNKAIIFGLSIGALFTGIVGTLGADFVWGIYNASSLSEDMELPMWAVYSAIPLGSYLMCFRFLQVMYQFIRYGELPKKEHADVEGLEDEMQGANA